MQGPRPGSGPEQTASHDRFTHKTHNTVSSSFCGVSGGLRARVSPGKKSTCGSSVLTPLPPPSPLSHPLTHPLLPLYIHLSLLSHLPHLSPISSPLSHPPHSSLTSFTPLPPPFTPHSPLSHPPSLLIHPSPTPLHSSFTPLPPPFTPHSPLSHPPSLLIHPSPTPLHSSPLPLHTTHLPLLALARLSWPLQTAPSYCTRESSPQPERERERWCLIHK